MMTPMAAPARAPSGAGADNRIRGDMMQWRNANDGEPGPNEKALVKWSTNHGETFGGPVTASPSSNHPHFPAIAA
jgi:hypothetical protein